MAFCSLVYSVVAVPALTKLTLTFGYFFSKAATMSLVCGAHAHSVSVVGCCSAAAMEDALLAADGEPPEELALELAPELEHAASAAARARPTAAPAAVLAIRERGGMGIVAPLLSSLIFFFCRVLAAHPFTLPAARPDRQYRCR
jgi:hypothetical protein